MPTYQCVEKCFWKGILWSPFTDGKTIYEGDDELPKGKDGRPFFKELKLRGFEPIQEPSRTTEPAWTPTGAVIQKWALQKLNKAELLQKMRVDYKTEIDEMTVTRKDLINMVLEKQLNEPETNQNIARVLKG